MFRSNATNTVGSHVSEFLFAGGRWTGFDYICFHDLKNGIPSSDFIEELQQSLTRRCHRFRKFILIKYSDATGLGLDKDHCALIRYECNWEKWIHRLLDANKLCTSGPRCIAHRCRYVKSQKTKHSIEQIIIWLRVARKHMFKSTAASSRNIGWVLAIILWPARMLPTQN